MAKPLSMRRTFNCEYTGRVGALGVRLIRCISVLWIPRLLNEWAVLNTVLENIGLKNGLYYYIAFHRCSTWFLSLKSQFTHGQNLAECYDRHYEDTKQGNECSKYKVKMTRTGTIRFFRQLFKDERFLIIAHPRPSYFSFQSIITVYSICCESFTEK